MNKLINRLKYTYPNSENIFEIKHDITYHVAIRVSDMFIENNELAIETTLTNLQKATLRISLVDHDMLNIKYSQKYFPTKRFNEHINGNFSLPKYKLIKQKIGLIVAAEVNSKIITTNSGTKGALTDVEQIIIDFKNKTKRLIITKNPFNMEIEDIKTKTIQFTLNWRDGFSYFGGFTAPGLGFKQISDKKMLPFLSWAIRNDEKTFGLGEDFGKFEKTGTKKTIFNTDTSGKINSGLNYNAIPFIASSYNFGLLLNTGYKSFWDIGASIYDASSLMNSAEYLDLFIFAGNSLKDIIQDYTKLTGRINGIDDRAYGIWYSKLYYHDKEQVFDIINQAKNNKLPIDVINIDPKWLKNRYTKSCNFVIADERFGDIKEFFTLTTQKDVAISFWINPYIQSDNSEFYQIALEKGFLVRNNMGGYAHPYTGVEVYQENNFIIDFTNPEAYTFWKSKLIDLFSKGLRYTIVDYGDGVPEEAEFFNGKNGLEMRQYFTYLYNKAAHEANAEVYGQENTANIARPGYIGTHKFPGKWGGDSYARWSELKFSVRAGLSISMTGEVLWGTDIGGFISDVDDKLYNRWLQYGTLVPYTRLHGISHREPWHFGEKAIKIAKTFFEIKRKWLPHYKIGEYNAIKTGITIMRPLAIEFQNDSHALLVEDQYMLNDNIMIAPLLSKLDERNIYFPEGTWVNYFNKKEIILGNHFKKIKYSDLEYPIFVKANEIFITFESGQYEFKDLEKQTLLIEVFGTQTFKGCKKFKINNKKIQINYSIIKGKMQNIEVVGWNKYKVKEY